MQHTDGIKSIDVKAHKITSDIDQRSTQQTTLRHKKLLIRLSLAAYIRGAMTMGALSL